MKLAWSALAFLSVLLILGGFSCGGHGAASSGNRPANGDDDDDDDTTPALFCGDGICSPGENCLNCPQDCACSCGDGVCTLGEFCANCPKDCDCETLAATPPMAWNSWNKFACDIDEATIRQIADAVVSSGMREAGYMYVNLDDCWQSSRDANGTIVADPARFPSGIPALAAYVHKLGLKFGVYTCAGTETCQSKPGSYGYEYQDMQTYADWGVDYVKVDWCNTTGLVPEERYAVFHDAIKAAGGKIVLSICEWGEDAPWIWGPRDGQLWRTTGDISDKFLNMWWNMLQTEPNAPFAGPGAWNDPDMLEVGNGGMSDEDYQTHFSLWAMMAAPLIAGNDLRNMDAGTLAILTNKEVIAVDQDPDGVPGRRMTHLIGPEVWTRPLTLDGARAVLLFNDFLTDGTVTVDWEEIGLAAGSARVRDLWTHEFLGDFKNSYSTKLGPFKSQMLLVTGAENLPPAGATYVSALPWKYAANYFWDVGLDRSAGGHPLTVAGVKYARGLGASAASQILYQLGGGCSTFTADVGVDDETGSGGEVVFQVWTDGVKLYDSGDVKSGQAARSMSVDLAGRRELKLIVTPATDSVVGDHADWANARLVCSGSSGR